MKSRTHATINELSKAVGKHETSVRRDLAKIGAKFSWRKGPKGNEKHYVAALLPQAYRLALVAMDAVPVPNISLTGDQQIGAEAATEILRERATEKMRDQIAQEQSLEAFERLPEKRRKEAEARYRFLQMCNGFVERARFTIRRYALRSKVGDQAFVDAYNLGRLQVDEDILAIIGKTTSYSTLKRIADAHYAYGITLPMPNHNYLKTIAWDLADKADAQREYACQQFVSTRVVREPQHIAAVLSPLDQYIQGQRDDKPTDEEMAAWKKARLQGH